jgi:hypothetical protein
MSMPTQATDQKQFGRVCTLLVVNNKINITNATTAKQAYGVNASTVNPAIDLSTLRIKFSVKRSDSMTPNIADIRVYNVSAQTAAQIQALQNAGQVILQAGYESNFGVIFKGNIRQVIIGQETPTETFVDIIAGDGDRAYNFSIVNTTIAAGSKQSDHINAVLAATKINGVSAGSINDLDQTVLPRAKVLYDSAKNVLRKSARTSGSVWSIQDEQIQFISQTSYLPGTAVPINAASGMIGAPQQTNAGVNVRCLLNPKIRISGRVQLNNASIQKLKIDLSVVGTAASIIEKLNVDGVYYVFVIEHQGDTRGTDWYTNLIMLKIAVGSNPINSIQGGI